jgi:hypothetical protein
MIIWGLQLAINLVFFVVVLQLFATRKKVDRLELAIRNLMVERHQSEPIVLAAAPSPVEQTVALKSHSSLVEHKMLPQGMNTHTTKARSFQEAADLLGQGLSTAEVSRKTGLSLSELQLVSKVARHS